MNRVYALWRADEEQFIIDTYSTLKAFEQAVQLERHLADVVAKRMRMMKKGQLNSSQRAYHPPWTKEQDEWLTDNYHKYIMKTLMRRLHRTETAIILRKRKLGIIRTDYFYTARALAAIFGCDPKKFSSLYQEGYLKGKKAPYLQGTYHPWVFNEAQVVRFLRKYPWLMDPKKMNQEHYFRGVLRRQWDANPWLDSKQAAALVGVGDEAILKRLRTGEIPAFQRSPGSRWSHWWIRRNELLKHFRRHDTTEDKRGYGANSQRSQRERSGLPRILYKAWEVICQDCAAAVEIRAPVSVRGSEILVLAKQQHRCEETDECQHHSGRRGPGETDERGGGQPEPDSGQHRLSAGERQHPPAGRCFQSDVPAAQGGDDGGG